MKILVVMPVNEEHKRVLEEAAGVKGDSADIVYEDAQSVSWDVVQSADIIIGNVAPDMIRNSSNLKLLQLNSAGTDGYTADGVLPGQAVLTNASGAYGLAIAEHMMGMLLCLMKKINLYQDSMNRHSWDDHGPVTSIYGSKTLIVGLGDIGNEFAVRMNFCGSKVSAIRRKHSDKPEYIDRVYQMDELYEALKEADIVAACLPGTSETYRLFNEEAFSHMKKNAYFINVGRGTAVDTDALVKVLNNGDLAGACLDVVDPEPLPAEHPLWNADNVLITPHVSGGYHLQETHDRIVRIAARNIVNLIEGNEFENLVDMKSGYRINK